MYDTRHKINRCKNNVREKDGGRGKREYTTTHPPTHAYTRAHARAHTRTLQEHDVLWCRSQIPQTFWHIFPSFFKIFFCKVKIYTLRTLHMATSNGKQSSHSLHFARTNGICRLSTECTLYSSIFCAARDFCENDFRRARDHQFFTLSPSGRR